MLNQLLWKKIVQNILQPSSWVYSKYIWDLQVLLGVVQLVHLNFFPQATASIHVKEEFGDVNCFFLSVAKIIYKISLLLTRCSRQEGLKLQKNCCLLTCAEMWFQLLLSLCQMWGISVLRVVPVPWKVTTWEKPVISQNQTHFLCLGRGSTLELFLRVQVRNLSAAGVLMRGEG